MITQYILSQDEQNKVDELNKKIAEIKLLQSEKISKLPFKEQRIYNELIKNPAIELLQQEIADIYSKSTTKY